MVKAASKTVMIYLGATGHPRKERLCNHKTSFNQRQYENSTTLSKYVWEEKDQSSVVELKIIKKSMNLKDSGC